MGERVRGIGEGTCVMNERGNHNSQLTIHSGAANAAQPARQPARPAAKSSLAATGAHLLGSSPPSWRPPCSTSHGGGA